MKMIHRLSVLIPVYREVCVPLVSCLCAQCAEREDLLWEILVADDASDDASLEENEAIAALPHCRFFRRSRNTGAAATRNFLVGESHYPHLLFLDSDVEVSRTFISDYLAVYDGVSVVSGGVVTSAAASSARGNLRYRYERVSESRFSAKERMRRPYHGFRSVAFMAPREVMLRFPFDERLRRLEDVLWGERLKGSGVPVRHVDIPVWLTRFEDNAAFLAKTERDIATLCAHFELFATCSSLLRAVSRLPRVLLCLWHKLFGAMERKNVLGPHARVWVYNLYRLGLCAVTLSQKERAAHQESRER